MGKQSCFKNRSKMKKKIEVARQWESEEKDRESRR